MKKINLRLPFKNLKKWYFLKTRTMTKSVYPFDPKLEKEERRLAEEDDGEQIPPVNIISFNELRSCHELARLVDTQQLEIDPDFQRSFVWEESDQTKFIDSLMKELPIPSICIAYDATQNKRIVIDGRQRITTIINFLDHDDFRLSNLQDVDEKIRGKEVREIKAAHKNLYDKVANLMMPVTVIRCSFDDATHMKYLFKIFHRLNSGGMKLNNQEIRNCIYSGAFNTFLKDSVEWDIYCALMNIKKDENYRFLYEEINLRFFAFYDGLESYTGKLASFLSEYMHSKTVKEKKNKEDLMVEIIHKQKLLEKTVNIIYYKIFDKKPVNHLSMALTEAMLVGVCRNWETLEKKDAKIVRSYFDKLQTTDEFSTEELNEGMAQKRKLVPRIKKAIEVFAGN